MQTSQQPKFNPKMWIPDIVCKLNNEGIYKINYTRESAIKALSGCVAAHRLTEMLIEFEDEVIQLL
jgi:hypothetical protein